MRVFKYPWFNRFAEKEGITDAMKYRSDILEIIHENASANFEIGAISEARMREYDKMCLTKDNDTARQPEASSKEENIPVSLLHGA